MESCYLYILYSCNKIFLDTFVRFTLRDLELKVEIVLAITCMIISILII